MNFKKWYLNEVGTGTSSVAIVPSRVFGGNLVSRTFPPLIADSECEDDKEKEHKKKKKD